MHKPFYASGFIYHQPTQQILLQQFKNGDETKLILFREVSNNGHDPKTVFQKCLEKTLGVSVPSKSIKPVYDYMHDQLGAHFIFFAEVSGKTPKNYTTKNKTEWCPLSKLSKLSMSEQTRHDIVVAERVIRSLFELANPAPQVKRH